MSETPNEFRPMTDEEFKLASEESLRLQERGAVVNPETGSLNVPQDIIDGLRPEAVKELLKKSVDVMVLDDPSMTTRVHGLLRDGKIFTIEDLTNKTASELLRIEGFGRKSLNETQQWLNDRGLDLKK